MSFREENDCVGCPQGCIHCGRGGYLMVECDMCGDASSGNEMFFEYNGSHFCRDCFPKFLKDEGLLEEVEEGSCTYCAEDAEDVEKMFKIDGETVCDVCLDDYLEEHYAYGKASCFIDDECYKRDGD